MSLIIKQFYCEHNFPKPIIEQKIQLFEKHQDIASEFEGWIVNGSYKEEGAVTVEGYTAKKLAETSCYLNGDGAFAFLIELRENPVRAKIQLEKGLKKM